MKRIISIIFILSLFLGMVGCMSRDGDKNEYDYPEYLTAEYCYNNYCHMSLNYIYPYTYKNSVEGVHKVGNCRRYFYAIPGVDVNDFLLCFEYAPILWEAYGTAYIYKANDNDIEPLINWKIDYIELCLQKYDSENTYFTSPGKCRDVVTTFGNHIYHKNINKITDPLIVEKFIECINDRSKYISSVPEVFYDPEDFTDSEDFSESEYIVLNRERGKLVRIEGEEGSYLLSVRIHFKETDMIMWSSDIILYDDRYYLEDYHDENEDHDYYIPLTEELEEIISSTIQSVNQSNEST